MEESWQAVRLQVENKRERKKERGQLRQQQPRQQRQRQQQGLLKERTIPEGRENVVAVQGREERTIEKENPASLRRGRRGKREESGVRCMALCCDH